MVAPNWALSSCTSIRVLVLSTGGVKHAAELLSWKILTYQGEKGRFQARSDYNSNTNYYYCYY